MEIIGKLYLLLFSMLIAFNSYSQEMNLGGEVGIISNYNLENSLPTINILYEYHPTNAIFSFNTNPGVILGGNKAIGTLPFYLKFIIGNKYKVCPSAGVFYWTNKTFGWSGGLIIEALFKEKYTPFIKANYMNLFYERHYPSHFGNGYDQITNESNISLAIGFKYRFK